MGPLADGALELAQQILGFAAARVGAGPAEDSADELQRRLDAPGGDRWRTRRRCLRRGGIAQLKGESKAARGGCVHFDACEVEGPHRRELALERDQDVAPDGSRGVAVAPRDCRSDWRKGLEAVVVDVHDVAGVRLARVACEQIEAHRAVDGQGKRPAARGVYHPFVRAPRHDADGARTAFPRDADEVSAARPPSDANAPPQPRERVRNGPSRHRQIGIRVRQARHGPAAFSPAPSLERRDQALRDARGAEDATVEQHRVRGRPPRHVA